MTERRLKKAAQIGNTIFHVGVSERLVIQRAQREYEHWNSPEMLAEREKLNALVDEACGILRKKKSRRRPSTTSK